VAVSVFLIEVACLCDTLKSHICNAEALGSALFWNKFCDSRICSG